MSLKLVTGVLNVSRNILNLRACLRGGMSFRWKLVEESEESNHKYIGVIGDKIYILCHQNATIKYSVYYNPNTNLPLDTKDLSIDTQITNELVDYFRLDMDLQAMYTDWSERDVIFKRRVEAYPYVLNGIRVLRQDPIENLFSFICSSNNHIKRITQMVANMCIHFGQKIGNVENEDYYSFPTISRLAQSDVEAKLKSLSFGYRGKFISRAAIFLDQTESQDWLYSLRTRSYPEAHRELCRIYGVGKKVADCVCLMSMDKLQAIPVDTHVLSIAKSQYNFCANLKQNPRAKNNLNDSQYREIGDQFKRLWGQYAGWAQTVMFIDDLKGFKEDKNESKLKKSTSSVNLVKEEVFIRTVKAEPGVSVVKTEPGVELKDNLVKLESCLFKTECLEIGNVIDGSRSDLKRVKRYNGSMAESPGPPARNKSKSKKTKMK